MAELTDETLRLREIYHSLTAESVLESLTHVMMMTSTDRKVAKDKAAGIIHMNGKNRSILNNYDMVLDEDKLKSDYVDRVLKTSQVEILNRYLVHLGDKNNKATVNKTNDLKLKTLVVYVMVKDLYSYVDDFTFPDEYRTMLDLLVDKFNEEKDKMIQELVDYFNQLGLPKHAERSFEVGFPVLDLRTDRALPLYFADLVQEGEIIPDISTTEDYVLEIRSRFLSVSKTLQINDLCDIISHSESTYRKKVQEINTQLRTFITSEELDTLTQLINYV